MSPSGDVRHEVVYIDDLRWRACLPAVLARTFCWTGIVARALQQGNFLSCWLSNLTRSQRRLHFGRNVEQLRRDPAHPATAAAAAANNAAASLVTAVALCLLPHFTLDCRGGERVRPGRGLRAGHDVRHHPGWGKGQIRSARNYAGRDPW